MIFFSLTRLKSLVIKIVFENTLFISSSFGISKPILIMPSFRDYDNYLFRILITVDVVLCNVMDSSWLCWLGIFQRRTARVWSYFIVKCSLFIWRVILSDAVVSVIICNQFYWQLILLTDIHWWYLCVCRVFVKAMILTFKKCCYFSNADFLKFRLLRNFFAFREFTTGTFYVMFKWKASLLIVPSHFQRTS